MKPAKFSFVAPESLDEVVQALAAHGDDARILAGGQSLVPLMNLRLARPEVLVSINRCDELDYIRLAGDRLALGALVRQIDAETSTLVQAECPLLAKALRYVGLPATRNRGTVCGSLAHCDPLAELPAVALALDAELVLTSAAGERRVPAHDFFVAEMTTCIEPGEFVSAVTFTRQDPGERSVVGEVSNGGHVFPVGGVALRWASANGECTMARIAAFGVGSVAQRLVEAEDALVGSDLGPAAIAAACWSGPQRDQPDRRHPRRRRVPAPPRRRAARTRPAGGGRLMTAEHEVAVTVNGRRHQSRVEPRRLLVDYLRHDLGLTGTHIGCEQGVCGACTVLLDGRTARSCLHFAVAVDGSEIRTVEDLAGLDELHPIQEMFHQKHALQCGFCTPGFLLTAVELLENTPDPDEAAIREALMNNVCRCTGYANIVDAVAEAAVELRRGQQA